jgi:mono/diheme cytochrome c family protein
MFSCGVNRADAGQAGVQDPVTFTKDIAPILQRACQSCHRPGSVAPMSLLTYEDARPWARSIKQRVSAREMPPWYIDRTVGVQKFKDDPSLSDAEIEKIVKWSDSGAPRGNPSDLPPARQFEDAERWTIGKPDYIISIPKEYVVKANAADDWPQIEVDTQLTEDRYIKAVETKPSKLNIVHHVTAYMLSPDGDPDKEQFLSEYAMGKNGDVFPEGAGRLIKAGTKLRLEMHYHSIGEEVKDRTQIAFIFYPKGYVPKRIAITARVGSNGGGDLDIPGGAENVRSDGYTRMTTAAKLTGFQPHMHNRGKMQCVEAIYPNLQTEMLSCAKFNFGWALVYNYADDAAPLVPAGTILHIISIHDNSISNKGNPDPKNWAGNGNRTIDEMAFSWMSWFNLTNDEYNQEVAARRAQRLTAVGSK